jgi:hypothetical protein
VLTDWVIPKTQVSRSLRLGFGFRLLFVVPCALSFLSCHQRGKPQADAVGIGADIDSSPDRVSFSRSPDGRSGDAGASLGGIAGWERLPWYGNEECHLFVPRSRDDLPARVAWTPCASRGVDGGGCEQMRVDWDAREGDNLVGWLVRSQGWVQEGGAYTFAISRAVGPIRYYLVADADGPIHSAIAANDESRCRIYPQDVRDGRVVYRVYESDGSGRLSAEGGGALVADIDDLKPRAYLRFHDRAVRSFLVGQAGVLEVRGSPDNTVVLHGWTNASSVLFQWSSADEEGLRLIPLSFSRDAVFFQASSAGVSKVKVWTAPAGVRDLVSFAGDVSQSAADLGTDGHTLVWLWGANRAMLHGQYLSVSFMSSPFATELKALRPRRLCSEPGGIDGGTGFGASLTQVGCGYAAREFPGGIRIIRLSDGRAWTLGGSGPDLGWGQALAVTCSHVYGQAHIMWHGVWTSTIARVRLDSLGKGVACN